MSTLGWILTGGLAMTAIALVGSVTVVLSQRTLARIILPLVAFAAGSLLGGAFFHMLPAAIETGGAAPPVFLWLLIGFTAFYVLEQFLHWHHSHRSGSTRAREPHGRPLTYLILVGDGLHNLLGGLAVGGAFIADIELGIAAWIAAALHEVPQEIGDFGVLIHGGWPRRRALFFNFLSALSFPIGGLLAYVAAFRINVDFLLPFAAGTFIYIAASDLVPEIKGHHGAARNTLHFLAFTAGMGLLYVIA